MFKIVLAILLSVTIVTSLESKRNFGIFGGREVDITKYPWQVSLRNHGVHICGGFLVSFEWVVTSAECLIGRDYYNDSLSIEAGSSYSEHSPFGQVIHVAKAIIHPQYDGNVYENDIGLVQLITPVTNEVAKMAKLSEPNVPVPQGINITVIGWGETQNFFPSRTLKEVEVVTVDKNICQQRYSNTTIAITANKFCAGMLDVGGKGPCYADNGGPAMVNDVIIGVISVSQRCGDPYFPDVYMQLSNYIEWIKSITGI